MHYRVLLDMKPVDHYMIDDAIDIELQPRGFYKETVIEMCYLINEEVEDSEMIQSTEVSDRAYISVTAKEMTSQQTHLTTQEQASLEKVLTKYSIIFDGKIKYWIYH